MSSTSVSELPLDVVSVLQDVAFEDQDISDLLDHDKLVETIAQSIVNDVITRAEDIAEDVDGPLILRGRISSAESWECVEELTNLLGVGGALDDPALVCVCPETMRRAGETMCVVDMTTGPRFALSRGEVSSSESLSALETNDEIINVSPSASEIGDNEDVVSELGDIDDDDDDEDDEEEAATLRNVAELALMYGETVDQLLEHEANLLTNELNELIAGIDQVQHVLATTIYERATPAERRGRDDAATVALCPVMTASQRTGAYLEQDVRRGLLELTRMLASVDGGLGVPRPGGDLEVSAGVDANRPSAEGRKRATVNAASRQNAMRFNKEDLARMIADLEKKNTKRAGEHRQQPSGDVLQAGRSNSDLEADEGQKTTDQDQVIDVEKPGEQNKSAEVEEKSVEVKNTSVEVGRSAEIVKTEEHEKSAEINKSGEVEEKSAEVEKKSAEGEKSAEIDKPEEHEKSAEVEEKLAEVEEKLAEVEEKLAEVEEKSAEVEEKSAEVEKKSAEVEKKSAEMEKSAEVEEKLAEVEEKLAEVEEKLAEVEKSAEVEKKSAEVEKKSAEEEKKSAEMEKSAGIENKSAEVEKPEEHEKTAEIEEKSAEIKKPEKQEKSTEVEKSAEMEKSEEHEKTAQVEEKSAEVEEKTTEIEKSEEQEKTTEVEEKTVEQKKTTEELEKSTEQDKSAEHEKPIQQAISAEQEKLNEQAIPTEEAIPPTKQAIPTEEAIPPTKQAIPIIEQMVLIELVVPIEQVVTMEQDKSAKQPIPTEQAIQDDDDAESLLTMYGCELNIAEEASRIVRELADAAVTRHESRESANDDDFASEAVLMVGRLVDDAVDMARRLAASRDREAAGDVAAHGSHASPSATPPPKTAAAAAALDEKKKKKKGFRQRMRNALAAAFGRRARQKHPQTQQ